MGDQDDQKQSKKESKKQIDPKPKKP